MISAPTIETMQLAEIHPDPENPREISVDAMDGLRTSLEHFGYVDLLVVNRRNMQLVSGHQRLKLLLEDSIPEASVIMVDLDELQQKALAVTLNNPEICGEFTQTIIPILERLRKEMPNEYLDLRIASLRKQLAHLELDNAGAGRTLPDDIPADVERITQLGDVWILGDHRLICGDSTKPETVSRLFAGFPKAKLLATDPPYLVNYTGQNRPNGGKDWTPVYRESEIGDFRKFYMGFFEAAFPFVEVNSAIYVWHAFTQVRALLDVCDAVGVLVHQNIIWVKPAALFGYSVYPWRHEACVFGWRRGHRPETRYSVLRKDGTAWYVGLIRSGDPSAPEYYTDLWEVDYEGKQRPAGIDHPTVKATELFAIPMRVHTQPGDICFDPFSGSGSQIIAGERTNRRVFAIEIEPFFCDVAVRRWENFAGKKAQLVRP